MAFLKRVFLGGLGGLGLVACGVAAPVVWTETACRADPQTQTPARVVSDADQTRPEARTALVVPEWEIVYAYEDFARVVADAPPHAFDYAPAISGFWSTLCAVRAEADRFGDPGTDAKITIYTIGVSFTVEMVFKAAYEETLGRLVWALSGSEKTAQDRVEAEMAAEYGAFLHQTPWYRFPFSTWRARLWEPEPDGVRGWERRLAVGAEWSAKSGYAALIQGAVGTMAPDKLTMGVHVRGLSAESAARLPHARVLSETEDGLLLEADRYRLFTETVKAVASQGGTFTEIAGNDDVLVSVLSAEVPEISETARILRRTSRQGDVPDRFLIAVKVPHLTDLVRAVGPDRVEHIYDY